jgi:tetratricopeptide (TPR) repeat protein
MNKFMAIIAAFFIISMNSLIAAQQTPLPEFYGAYILENGKLIELDKLQKVGFALDSARKGIELNYSGQNVKDPNLYFILYEKDPLGISGSLIINKLQLVKRYLRWTVSQSYSNPPEVRDINKWLVTNVKIGLKRKPVENKQDMIILKPEKALQPGVYSLSLGSDEGGYYVFSVNYDDYDKESEALDRITPPGWDGWTSDSYVPFGKYLNTGTRRSTSSSSKETKEITSADIHVLQMDGMKYIEQSQYQSAEEKFLKAIELKSYCGKGDTAQSYLGLGLALAYQHKFKEAIDNFKLSVSLVDNRPDPYYSLASIYVLQDDKDQAIQFFEKALEKGFKNFDFLRNDTDFDGIRDDPRFQKLLETKR